MNNAIEVENFKFNQEIRTQKRKELNAEETINLVNIGRFNTQKNQLFLLDIFAEIIKQNKNYQLFLVGLGDLEVKLKQKSKRLKSSRQSKFFGFEK